MYISFLLNLNISFSTFLLWKKIIHNTVYEFCIFTGGSKRNIFNYFPCMFFINFPHNKNLIRALKSGGWGLEAVAGLRYFLRVEMQAYWFTYRTLAHWRQSTFQTKSQAVHLTLPLICHSLSHGLQSQHYTILSPNEWCIISIYGDSTAIAFVESEFHKAPIWSKNILNILYYYWKMECSVIAVAFLNTFIKNNT